MALTRIAEQRGLREVLREVPWLCSKSKTKWESIGGVSLGGWSHSAAKLIWRLFFGVALTDIQVHGS
jgi:hypothetical protein